MSLVYKNNSNKSTSIGIWKKEESYSDLFKSTLLTIEEEKDLKETKLEKRRLEKIVTRKLIQVLLPDFGKIKYHGLTKLSTGKPLLKHCPIELSVSHCEEYIAVQLTTNRQAGIDIQNINEKLCTVAPRVFSKEELQEINNDSVLLARAWSGKEAIFKFYEKGKINFIRDIKLENIMSPEKFIGFLKRGEKVISIKLNCINSFKDYQIVYCDE